MTQSSRTTLAATEPVMQDRFREVMAGVCTPVAVVTSFEGEDPYGTTVSAFASLSMDPPMVLVSLGESSGLLATIRRSDRFGLNVLGSAQAALAGAFARKGGTDKFIGVPWEEAQGVPRIPEAPGFLACEVSDLVIGGDHIIVLGTVVAAEYAAGAPLTYHARTFGTYAQLTRDG